MFADKSGYESTVSICCQMNCAVGEGDVRLFAHETLYSGAACVVYNDYCQSYRIAVDDHITAQPLLHYCLCV